jgi:hypothetical protein
VDLLIRGSAILQEHLLRQLRLLGLHRRLGARVPASPCAHPTSPFVNSKAAARVQQTPGSLLRHLPCPSSSAVSGGKKRTGKKRKGFELIFIDFRFVFTILSTFFHVYLGVSDLWYRSKGKLANQQIKSENHIIYYFIVICSIIIVKLYHLKQPPH